MKRLPLDENEHVSVLSSSTDTRHEGFPVVLMPYKEKDDELRLTASQALKLYEILRMRCETNDVSF